MRTVKKALLVVGVIVLAVVGVVVYYVANPNLPHYQAPSEVRYLPQWQDEARQRFYYTPQGTLVKGLHYDWFTALELPFSEEPFAAPEYLARFGFLVDPQQKASDLNPGNLPVGFSQHRDEKTGTRYLDITCAACHTGELRYQGKSLRIDGGAKFDIYALLAELTRRGKALVVVSSDLRELMLICDRIGVLSAGRMVDTFERDAWTQDALLAAAFAGYKKRDALLATS